MKLQIDETIDSPWKGSGEIELGPLDDLVGYHLRRAHAVVSGDFAQIFADTAMRQVLFGVMSVISANPGINQGQVGKVLGVQRTNMVALVNQLVELGFVQRKLDRRDRRAFSLTLTEPGQHTLGEALRRIRVHEDRLLDRLTAKERTTLVTLLRRIRSTDGQAD